MSGRFSDRTTCILDGVLMRCQLILFPGEETGREE